MPYDAELCKLLFPLAEHFFDAARNGHLRDGGLFKMTAPAQCGQVLLCEYLAKELGRPGISTYDSTAFAFGTARTLEEMRTAEEEGYIHFVSMQPKSSAIVESLTEHMVGSIIFLSYRKASDFPAYDIPLHPLNLRQTTALIKHAATGHTLWQPDKTVCQVVFDVTQGYQSVLMNLFKVHQKLKKPRDIVEALSTHNDAGIKLFGVLTDINASSDDVVSAIRSVVDGGSWLHVGRQVQNSLTSDVLAGSGYSVMDQKGYMLLKLDFESSKQAFIVSCFELAQHIRSMSQK